MSSGQRLNSADCGNAAKCWQDCKQLANKSAFAKKNPLWPLFANEVASAVQLVTNDILNMGNWMKDNDYPHLPPNPFISATKLQAETILQCVAAHLELSGVFNFTSKNTVTHRF